MITDRKQRCIPDRSILLNNMISFLSPKYSADSMPKNYLFGLCNQFLSNSMSIVFNFRAGFGDVQSIIVKIAHAKRKKKTLVPWMMKKLSKDERKILDRDTEASGHKGIYIIMQLFH